MNNGRSSYYCYCYFCFDYDGWYCRYCTGTVLLVCGDDLESGGDLFGIAIVVLGVEDKSERAHHLSRELFADIPSVAADLGPRLQEFPLVGHVLPTNCLEEDPLMDILDGSARVTLEAKLIADDFDFAATGSISKFALVAEKRGPRFDEVGRSH